jgi:hypothetical protein
MLFTVPPHTGDDCPDCDWVIGVAAVLSGLQVWQGFAEEAERGIDAHLRALDSAQTYFV